MSAFAFAPGQHGQSDLAGAGFHIRVVQDVAALGAEWPEGGGHGGEACHYPFQTRAFLKVWCATYGRFGRRSLHFVEISDLEGRPLIFLPLSILRRGGVRVLEFIDAGAADYNAPVLFGHGHPWTPSAMRGLWSDILAALPPVDVVNLTKMPAMVDGLANPFALIAEEGNPVSCHGRDLRGTWADVEARLPRRQSLAKKLRKLESLAPLTFGVACREDELAAVNLAFMRQKQWRFEATGVPGFEFRLDKRDFFGQGTPIFARQGMLRLFYLRSGDTVIATVWTLVTGPRCYAIMTSFEGGDWARFSPGGMIFARLARHLHDEGYEWLDFGIGDECWKLEGETVTVPLVALAAALTPRGRLHLVKERWLSAARASAAWQGLRRAKWSALRRLRR